MNLKILWMYHDLMDLYGDKGNAEVLRVRAMKRGIDVTLDTCTIGEEKDISSYDLFFMGGGADHEQGLIHEDLLSRKENIQKAMDEKVDLIGLSGLITPSLEEMVHVATELEKAGLDIPLLIGGATTSLLHTALRIAPVYHAPVVHLKDASQNVGVAARLMNPAQRVVLMKELDKEYADLRLKYERKQSDTIPLEEARKNRLKLF